MPVFCPVLARIYVKLQGRILLSILVFYRLNLSNSITISCQNSARPQPEQRLTINSNISLWKKYDENGLVDEVPAMPLDGYAGDSIRTP